ncbi:MAG TPA: copper resistance protein CopC [Actinomycetota bacterium]|nr:copper resistance protein CopC [Actinomycetota bacterium]
MTTGARFALAVAAVAVAMIPSGASAHSALESTDPANGALLETPPERIVLRFTEPPDPSLTNVEVVNASGAAVPAEVAQPGDDRHAVVVDVGDLLDDVYTVSWRVVSSVDGHLTAGTFSFGVGVSPGEVAPPESEAVSTPTPLAVAGRWGLYAGLAALLGAAITGLLAFGPASVRRPWVLAAAWLAAAAGVLVMTLEERAVVGVPLGTLLQSEAGATYLRLAVAVALAGIATLVVTLRPSTATLTVLAATAGLAIGFRADGGHAGGSATQAVLQGLHFAAVAAWIGGLVWLVLAVRRSADAAEVRRYSNVGAVGLGVLLVTGLLRATDELGGPGWWFRAFDNDYGTALVLKLAVVVPTIGLGAVNRFRNVRRYPSLGPKPMLRTVGGELVLAAGVLALTGVVTGLPPEGGGAPAGDRAAGPLVVTASDFATTTRVRLEIAPGTVGPNAFEAEITDYDTGEPVDARRVALTFRQAGRPDAGSTVELARGEHTWQAGATALSIQGIWEVDVLVEASSTSVEVPLLVAVAPPGQRVEVTRTEGQPELHTFDVSGGTLQVYVDPGEPGRTNQLHVTAFDPGGFERPLDDVAVLVRSPDGEAELVEPDPLSPGHVVVNVTLDAGITGFAVDATTEDGERIVAMFEQRFEE